MRVARPPISRPGADPARRRLLGALLAVPALAAGGLTGCREEITGRDDGPIELSVFWFGDALRAQTTERALRLYSTRNPRVSFRVTWQGLNGYYDRLATQSTGGNVPDLFQLDESVLTEYASRSITLDLDPYTADGRLDLSGLPPGLAEYGRVNGRVVGVPAGQTHAAVVYNRDLLRRLGVPAPVGAMPWADYVTWAARVTRASNGRVAGTMDPSGDLRALWLWLRGQGARFYQGRQLGFDSALLVDWFELWQRARADRATPAPALVDRADGGEPARQLVVTGHTAASFAWSHQLPELQRHTSDELALVGSPGPPAAEWDRASMYWAGFRGTRQPAVVADVIQFLATDVEAGRVLGTERGLPPDLVVRDAVTRSLTDPVTTRVAALGTAMRGLVGPAPAPPPRGHGRVATLLATSARTIRSGSAGVRATTTRFMAQAQSALAA
ncbi:extracellular solute-binding protein [Micromonospora sp. KC213]|uniref:ABC transporter substrate-binding protein n=1 Tax=Micromonospora sp. KC213 TaxID=2530378 RepID=UPI001046E188|nr:extracellular solute-binding protein [Micromonospora sp. KC213]TDC38455.1 extracellular solute-binding protein [Micromonospora sp. KC213]